ncbi:MAG: acyl-CoA thioesterase [Flavicella sp.]
MARIKLEAPEKFHFTTTIKLRVTDINYGGHLGNDAVLSLAHEARVQFLSSHGWNEMNVAGSGIIQADAAVVYKSEGFYGNDIEIDIAVFDMHRLGFDLFYTMKNLTTGKELAQVKTGIICFDYTAKKVTTLPEVFKNVFED